MKKPVALLLAIVLLLGMIPVAGAAFTDADKIAESHKKAVDYVSGKGVISGFPDGSFKPQDTLTRAQAAKILCVALEEGAEKANALTKADTGFTDVPASHWAAKYIAYCVDKGIVAGVGNGRFDPDGVLTAAAFAKMLLVAYGKEKAEALVGADWLLNTQKAVKKDYLNWGADSVANEPSTRENACQLAYNFQVTEEIEAVEPEAYKTTVINFTGGGKYRLLGRAQQTDKGVICDYSADGVEFTVDCKGTVLLTANINYCASNAHTFRVIVDGEIGEQVKLTKVGEFTNPAFVRIRPGVHTIRIVKDYEIMQAVDLLKSIELTCKPDTVKPTQPKEKLLFIVGDSTSAGFGIVKTDTPKTTTNSASAVYTYGYRTAEALGMDYEMVVKGTSGLVKQYGKPKPYNEVELFEHQNPYRAEGEKYAFPRKGDAAIIKLSGNDGKTPKAEMEAGMREIVRLIREHATSPEIPIVFFYYETSEHRDLAEKLIAEDPHIYGVIGLRGGKGMVGMGNHASALAHELNTERILAVLKPALEGK